MKEKSILFICTGNVFRSMSAEYAFKKYLQDNKISSWKVGSAGTIANPQNIDGKTIQTINKLGMKVNHKLRKVTKKLLSEYDVIVAMAEDHLEFIQSKLNHRDVLLFNELAIGKKTSIWDFGDEVKDYKTNRLAVEKFIEKTVKYIFKNIPQLYKTVCERYYLFEEFAEGHRKTHINGYAFSKLSETKNTLAFMSIDVSEKSGGHILVIPKKRYVDFTDIPTNILNELMTSIQKIGEKMRLNDKDYNILLNNGVNAGQFIFHAHFHIIIRKPNDGVVIEGWNHHKKISKKKFTELNKKLLKEIK